MIWVAGRIVRDEELSVSVLDRTFEHGLGLFETLRTWGGKAPLLAQHLGRMRASARALGLPFREDALPDEAAVVSILQAERASGDMMLRITLSGGFSRDGGSTLWMRALHMPPAWTPRHGATVCVGDWPVIENDVLARHKVLNYWGRRLAFERAHHLGFDETLSMSSRWHVWEGSRTNLFLVAGDSLITPSTKGPIIPGVMREFVLELAESLPFAMISQTEELTHERLRDAHEVFLTNSVRGIIPVSSLHALGASNLPSKQWEIPGRWAQRFSILIADRLNPAGAPPS